MPNGFLVPSSMFACLSSAFYLPFHIVYFASQGDSVKLYEIQPYQSLYNIHIFVYHLHTVMFHYKQILQNSEIQ